jgi:hypothetical protein
MPDANKPTSVSNTYTKVESDSDWEGDPLPVPISHGDAMSPVKKLKEYVMQHTETVGVSLCHMWDDMEEIFWFDHQK